MQTSQKHLTVVGMGMAGLGCAWNISQSKANVNLTLLEKSKKVGGRATSNSRNGFIYDHGANYFTFDGLSNPQRVMDIVKKHLPTKDLVIIPKDLYLFDEQSNIYKPKVAQESEKLTYKSGLIHLAELLKRDQELKVKFNQYVEKLSYCKDSKSWTITYINGNENNQLQNVKSDFLLLTPPAPQIVDLLKKSEYYKRESLIQIFEKCKYKKQIVAIFAFDKKIQNLPYFALLNEDRKHDIIWITVEDEKDGHVQQDKSLLICQMSEHFTDKFYDLSDEEVKQKINESLLKLIPQIQEQSMLDCLNFSWIKRWRYALPNNHKIPEESLKVFEEDGLYFAGDFLIGRGRVLQALEKGLIASDMIKSKL